MLQVRQGHNINIKIKIKIKFQVEDKKKLSQGQAEDLGQVQGQDLGQGQEENSYFETTIVQLVCVPGAPSHLLLHSLCGTTGTGTSLSHVNSFSLNFSLPLSISIACLSITFSYYHPVSLRNSYCAFFIFLAFSHTLYFYFFLMMNYDLPLQMPDRVSYLDIWSILLTGTNKDIYCYQ